MPNLKINEAPLLPDLTGIERIPTGGRGDYTTSTDQIKEFVKADVQATIDTEVAQLEATDAELLSLIEALANGATKAYLTFATLDAAKTTLPVNSFANVTNDPNTTLNGLYQWDGTTLTKSNYDPLNAAKAYVDASRLFKPVTLTVGTDFNTITEEGRTVVPTNAIANASANQPSSIAGILDVALIGSGVFQTYRVFEFDLAYERQKLSGGTWTDWVQSASKDMVDTTAANTLQSARDYADANPLFRPVALTTQALNSLTISGDYLQPNSANSTLVANYPVALGGKLTVINVDDFVVQSYLTRTTNERYERSLYAGVWSVWALVSAPDFFANKGGLSTANLNTRTTQGWFVQSNSANATLANNYPVVAAGRLDVFAVSATSLIWQRFTTTANVVYMRAYNGTTWSAWSQLTTTADVSAAQTAAQTTAIAYTDSQALNLFGKNNTELFASANLIVRRYLTTGASNDYAAGTYQTAVAGGLSVAVTAAGSGAITHYLRTALFNYTTVSGTFLINTINAAGQGEGCGVGCIDASGNYTAYIYTESGVVRKISNQTSIVIATGLSTYTVGDTIKISISNTTLMVYKNGIVLHTSTIAAPLVNEILVGQVGFVRYTVSVDVISDPIRDYVSEQTAQADRYRAPIYYTFDPTGGSSSAGLMTVYSQISVDNYVGFEVAHEVNATDLVYTNYWRIVQAKIYTLSTDNVMIDTGKYALGEGESEFVFKQNSSKDDFTGGVHGDEQITDIKFFANGIALSTASSIALTAAKTFEYFAKSTMHETAEGGVFIAGHPVIANHIKRTSFYNGGYKTFNRVTWTVATTISTLYHGISCVHKDVASSVMTEGTFTAQSMTGSNTLYFNELGSRQAIASNSANGLSASASATLLKPAADDATSLLFVQDRSTDSKYYRKSPARTVAIGEVTECEFSCFFNASA